MTSIFNLASSRVPDKAFRIFGKNGKKNSSPTVLNLSALGKIDRSHGISARGRHVYPCANLKVEGRGKKINGRSGS